MYKIEYTIKIVKLIETDHINKIDYSSTNWHMPDQKAMDKLETLGHL